MVKLCSKCGSRERYTNGSCAPCHRKNNRKWYEANRTKKYEVDRKWKLANPEKKRISDRKYRENHPERNRNRKRKWVLANPEKVMVIKQRRRARKKGNESRPYDFKTICEHYGNKCARCGNKIKLTIDHIKPISKGGPDIASNIQPLCRKCNSSKGVREIDYRSDAGPLRWIQRKLFGGRW